MSRTATKARGPIIRDLRAKATTTPSKYSEHMVTAPPVNDVLDVNSLGTKLSKKYDGQLVLDPKKASQILAMPTAPAERPVRDAWTSHLAKCMVRDSFLPEQTTIITCLLNGAEYRMNGQHTCLAVIATKKTYTVRHLIYSARTMADLRQLYASIDRNAPRTTKHVVACRVVGSDGFEEISDDIVRRLSEGISMWKGDGDTHKRLDADERAVLMLTDYKDHCQNIAKVFGTGSRANVQHLKRAPVVGAMFATFDSVVHGEKGANAFWAGVRDGEDLKTGDPRLVLRTHLLQSAVSVGPHKATGKKRTSSEIMFRWCIIAWNAFRKGEKVGFFKPSLRSPRPNVK